MSITPHVVVETPDPGPIRYGLFAASPPMALPPRARGGGVTYDLDHCGTAQTTIVECIAEAGSADDKEFAQGVGQNEADPFAVYAGIQCGRVGYTDPEFEARARARLAAGEQGAVELALWTGLDAVGGNPLGIDGFNNSSPATVSVTDPLDPVHVVSALEQFAYLTSGYAFEAYIHAPVAVAAFMAQADLVRMGSDGRLYTPFGSVWVFGGGYPGTDDGGSLPADGFALYVTGKVNVWQSSDILIPDPAQTLDRATNQQYVLAERGYAASFDCLLGEATYTPFGGS